MQNVWIMMIYNAFGRIELRLYKHNKMNWCMNVFLSLNYVLAAYYGDLQYSDLRDNGI